MSTRKMMKGIFKLEEEIENEDGTWSLIFDVDDEFKEWFKEWQGLKRWSHSRFQNVIYEALLNTIKQGEKNNENN